MDVLFISHNQRALENPFVGSRKNTNHQRRWQTLESKTMLEGQKLTKSIYDKQHQENQGSL